MSTGADRLGAQARRHEIKHGGDLVLRHSSSKGMSPPRGRVYRERLGFDITFQGPSDDDIFFGIVRPGAATIMLKDVGVDPAPNDTRDVGKGICRWDAHLHVPDPDALAAEFSSRNVEFCRPLRNDDDGFRGFEVKDADGYMLLFGRPRSRTLIQFEIRRG